MPMNHWSFISPESNLSKFLKKEIVQKFFTAHNEIKSNYKTSREKHPTIWKI